MAKAPPPFQRSLVNPYALSAATNVVMMAATEETSSVLPSQAMNRRSGPNKARNWSSDQGLLSTRQAQDYYNRYFNVKFMALRGDYNNCSHTCPNKQKVLFDMERELSDKERGLLRVSTDNAAYYRADELYQEVELVLEATCTACEAGR